LPADTGALTFKKYSCGIDRVVDVDVDVDVSDATVTPDLSKRGTP
jgi:hypothetical protein